jgi:hypothetical protein
MAKHKLLSPLCYFQYKSKYNKENRHLKFINRGLQKKNNELVMIWEATIVTYVRYYIQICLKGQRKSTKNI